MVWRGKLNEHSMIELNEFEKGYCGSGVGEQRSYSWFNLEIKNDKSSLRHTFVCHIVLIFTPNSIIIEYSKVYADKYCIYTTWNMDYQRDGPISIYTTHPTHPLYFIQICIHILSYTVYNIRFIV